MRDRMNRGRDATQPAGPQRRLSVNRASWLPDRQAKACMYAGCATAFTLRERRHHCRLCGQIFCGIHTGYTMKLDERSGPSRGSLSAAEDHDRKESPTSSRPRQASFLKYRSYASKAGSESPMRIKARDGGMLNVPFPRWSNAGRADTMVRVCNQCFLSVHDAEIVHEDDHCVPAGFICYLPRGPPYVTGPGGLGDLRLQIAPTPSGIIMPRARSVHVKRIELTLDAPGPVFVLRVFGGRRIPSSSSSSSRSFPHSSRTPAKHTDGDKRKSSRSISRAHWNVRRLFVHFQDLATYLGVPDSEIPRSGPSLSEPYALPVYAEIMNDYLTEWLDTDGLNDRLQHFLTADSSLMSTSSTRSDPDQSKTENSDSSRYRSSGNKRHLPDLVERIASSSAEADAQGSKSVAKTPVDMRISASPESTSGGANPAPVTAMLGTAASRHHENSTTKKRGKTSTRADVQKSEKGYGRKYSGNVALRGDSSDVSNSLAFSPLLHITHAEICTGDRDPHVQYVIRARSSDDSKVWFVTKRRFRFFEILHNQLKKKFSSSSKISSTSATSKASLAEEGANGNSSADGILPHLPRGSRSMMFVMGGRNFECSAVDDKRVKLESYLRSLLEIPEVQRSLELKTFLGTNPGRVLHDVPDVNAATAAAPRASNVSEPPAVDAGKEMQRRLGVSEGSEQGGSLAGGSSAAEVAPTKSAASAAALPEGSGSAPTDLFSAQYISMLVMEIAQLKAEKAQLAARIRELERQPEAR